MLQLEEVREIPGEIHQFVQIAKVDRGCYFEIFKDNNDVLYITFNQGDNYHKVNNVITWKNLCDYFSFDITSFEGFNFVRNISFVIDFQNIMDTEIYRLFSNQAVFVITTTARRIGSIRFILI